MNQKVCSSTCVSELLPANGCAGASCDACTLPAHAAATDCSGPGATCGFVCDTANGYVLNVAGDDCTCGPGLVDYGTYCGCAGGEKICAGNCVSTSSPSTGCASGSCDPCLEPAHAVADCSGAGGTCDFVCDSAGHWVKSSDQCVCAPGYTDQGGVCVPACPGSTYGASCYWYVASASTWDAAQSTCASDGGHLASLADSAENSFVRGLSTSTFWIGLRDYATISQTVDADDCMDNVWLSGNGGTYFGDTDDYDDLDPCGILSDADDIFGLTVTVPGMYVLSTANTSFDTVLGLYSRINNTSDYTTCVGSSIECDDDDGPGTRSLIVRYLGAGDYTVVMDGYTGWWGSYQLDVRRFDFVDGSAHAWANWDEDQPDNAGSAEDCTEVDWTSGDWNDLNCGTARPFVCERPL